MTSDKIGDEAFRELVELRAQKLLGLTNFLSHRESRQRLLTRPLLGALLSQSIQVEELLDAYDAGNNCQWCWFRSLTAAIKLFSDVSYELLHIQHVLPDYSLLPIETDFVKATEQVIDFTCGVLLKAANLLTTRARQLGLSIPTNGFRESDYAEQLPSGRLPRDCRARRAETVAETVTLLATAFLNLAADCDDIRAAGRAKPSEYDKHLSDAVTEDKLRSLQLRFHNLQSLYDTRVSGTEMAEMDPDLPVLRGHISVVFHLLKTATLFAHHFERHMGTKPCEIASRRAPLVNRDVLLAALMNYSIRHISLYTAVAENLCQDMLKRYAEVGDVEVPVPPYRGFHVRPSTLISKLVHHYGSEVRMEMDGEIYDAGSALELFRANEKINAQKRRELALSVYKLRVGKNEDEEQAECFGTVVHNVVLALAERGKVILYQQPLTLPEEPVLASGTLLDRVTAETTRLLTLGKIDVETEIAVKFVGDKRVLEDIELLAQSGYGEDKFGNNIPLPEKLLYLRR